LCDVRTRASWTDRLRTGLLSISLQRGSSKALPIGRAQLLARETYEEFYATFRNIVGGVSSPVISNLVLDGLEAVVHGSPWHRRVHNINYVRWADDFLVTATSRRVLAEIVLPRIAAFLAERGVRLSAEKTVITPRAQGCDF